MVGPVVPGKNPLPEFSRKRKAGEAPGNDEEALSSKSTPFIHHIETTGTLELPVWYYKPIQQDLTFLAEKVRNISKVQVTGNAIPEESFIAFIENNKDTLQEVSLELCSKYSPEFFSTLAKCSHLTILHIPRNSQVNSQSMTSIASISTLQELDLEECTQVGDDDVQQIARGNTELQKLKVSGCKNLTDRAESKPLRKD